MKARVLKDFKDKYTGHHYEVGNIIDLTEERYREILTVDKLVEQITEFEAMSITQLRKYADEKHKLTFGKNAKKADIIAELRRLENGK